MLAAGLHPGPTGGEHYPGSANRNVPPEHPAPDMPGAFEDNSSAAEPSPPRPIPARFWTRRLSTTSPVPDGQANEGSGRRRTRRGAAEGQEGEVMSAGEVPRDRHATFRAPPAESSRNRTRHRAGTGDSSQPLVPRTSTRHHDSDFGRREPSGPAIRSPGARPPRASFNFGGPPHNPFVFGPRTYTNGGPPYGGPPPFAENMGMMGPGRFDQARIDDVEQGLYQPETHHVPQPLLMGRVNWDDLSAAQKIEIWRLHHNSNRSAWRDHFVCGLGELVGTTLFLFFAFAATEVANIESSNANSGSTTGETTGFDIAVLFYISVAFGFSLMVNVWIFFRISGGLFNPAVTLGMYLVNAISVVRALVLFVAQILGGLLASVTVRFLFPESFNVRTTLGAGTNVAQGVFIEAILTAELVFTIFMLAYEKHRATFIAPVGIGLALFIAELVGVQFTGGSLNPSRSFGPCVIDATFDPEHWIYWVGPGLGSCIAVGFYKLIKLLEYELVNPGADSDHLGPTTTTEQVEDKSQEPTSSRPKSAPPTVISSR